MKFCHFTQLVFVLCLLTSSLSYGHDGRPVYVAIEDIGSLQFELFWRLPPVFTPAESPRISLLGDCQAQDDRAPSLTGRALYQCADSLGALSLLVEYPQGNPSLSTVVNVITPGYPDRFIHAGPEVREIKLDLASSMGGVFRRYLEMGVSHILSGFDHLLFVLCLIWLAFSWRRILLSVTGFTAAHSLTLGLAAFGFITPATAPTEVLIALSIVFVAAELVRQDQRSLSWRYPVIVSALFGLLHGLGFAGAIREIGLPNDDALWALFAFNVGVEIGQLLFITLMISLSLLVNRMLSGKPTMHMARIQAGSGYVIGTMAAFWFFERLVGSLA